MEDYEYDFGYELGNYWRLVEQMEPKGFRTFRSEFNISSEHHSSYTTTTHYSTQQYITHTDKTTTQQQQQQRSKDRYDGSDPIVQHQQQQQQPSPQTKTNGTAVSPLPTNWGTSMHFSEIRSLKRIRRVNEAIGTGEDIADAAGIVDPTTGDVLTVGDAIRLRVLDVRTGSIVTKGGASVPIDEAAALGLIDADLADRLLGPCSGADGAVSLLEAIQRELCDAAERGAYVGETSEKRIKVGERPDETGPSGVDITEAMSSGHIDQSDATYLLENGTRIPIPEAYERGHLVLKEVRVKPGSLTLSDALDRDLVDDRTGYIVDRNSGDRYQIDVALKHGLLDPDAREIVDPRSDTMVTLKRALETGIINRKSGRYVHAHEKISFREARRRRLIVKPMSLKDACDAGLIDARGTIGSPSHRTRLSILEAVSRGVLDSDTIRSILDTRTDELVTLSESLSAGIIRADTATFRDSLTGEVCPIPEAVDRGLIVSVSLKSIFDIDAFKDPHSNEYLSLNAALLKGLLSPKHGGSILADPSGRLAPIDETSGRDNLVKPNVLEMLLRPIGIRDGQTDLNVLESVLFGLLDPRAGQVVDPETKQTIPLNLAVEKGFITAEGAAFLDSLLNITVTIQSISKSVKRHVTITSSGVNKSEYTITFSEAVRRGLIDESTQTFQDPESGKVVSIQQALNEGLIDTELPRKSGKTVTKITSTLIIPPKTDNRYARVVSDPPESMEIDEGPYGTTRKITRDLIETERTVQIPTSSMEKQVFELPPDGWFLAEAIDQKLFDPVTGLFIIPGTDRLVSFEECVDLQIINPSSAKVVDPASTRYVTLKRSLEKRILDKTGHYRIDPKDPRDGQVTLHEAIVRNLVVLEDRTQAEPSNQRLIQITKVVGRPDLVEVSNVLDKNPPTFVEVKSTGHDEPSRTEPVQLRRGLIYDPSSALVIDTDSGTSETLIEAVAGKKVDPETVKVKDPNSGRYMDVSEAIRKGIVDGKTGEYKDQSGRKISLSDAAKFGVLAVLGAPLVAASSVAKIIKKGGVVDPKTVQEFVDGEKEIRITKEQKVFKTILIEDPSTGRQIPSEQALKEGLISMKDYENLERQLGDPETVRIVSGSKAGGPVADPKVVSTLTVRDPRTGRELTPREAIEAGVITREELDEMRAEIPDSGHVVETKTEIVSSSVVVGDAETGKEESPADSARPKAKSRDERRPTPAERTRSRVTTEPKYKVAIGCARRSFSRSPERDARPVVLQKMRKKVVRPKDAAAKGLIDAPTAEALENSGLFERPDGEPMTLGEAVSSQRLDGRSGAIVDPQRGDTVNINEAMSRGILDPDGTTSQILVPLNRSLGVPELYAQGLIDPETCRIVHPETGSHLTLREAILCDIVDPLSGISVSAPEDKITLQEAIDRGVVNEDRSTVRVDDASVDLLRALQMSVFDESSATAEIPPAGMTFQVAVRRGLVDTERKEIVHPITGERKPVKDAIDDDFIMAIPVPVVEGSVKIDEALDMRLIDEEKGTFKDPKTGEVVPISQAVEQGLLIIKPMEHMRTVTDPSQSRLASVTETITSYHTITTKIVEILPGYVLVNSKEVRNVQTGELIPIETAKERGIVLDESETQEKFKTRKIKMSFSDAVRKGLIDMSKGTFKDPESGKVVSVSAAIKDGLIDPERDGKVDRTEDPEPKVSKLNLIEAYERAFDEQTQRFVDPDDPRKRLSFSEALEREIVDPDSVIYDTSTGEPVSVKQAVERGLIEAGSGKIRDQTTGRSIDVKQAAKMGLLAIVGAPILAGIAVVDAVKRVKGDSGPKEKEKTPTLSEQFLIGERRGEAAPPPVRQIPRIVEPADESVELDDAFGRPPSEVLISYERMPVADAVASKRIEPKICRILVDGAEMPLTVQDALELGEIRPADVIDVIGKTKVSLVQERRGLELTLGKGLDPDVLVDGGAYDPQTGRFLDPDTGDPVTFERFVCTLEIFAPDSILVKDLNRPDTYVEFREALDRPLIDRHSGYMVDPKTGRRVDFFEAVRRGYIIERHMRPRKKLPLLSLHRIIEEGALDPKTGEITDPGTGDKFPFVDAINSGLVDPETVSVRDPGTNEIVTYSEAIETGIVDARRGVIVHLETRTEIEFSVAFVRGYLMAGPRKPVSLEATVAKRMYDPETGKIVDPTSKDPIDIREAVSRSIVDDTISRCKDTACKKWVLLSEALDSRLLDPETGKIKDTDRGDTIGLDRALERGIVSTAPVKFGLIDAIVQKYYSPRSCLVLDPVSGDELTVRSSIETGLVDPSEVKIKDPVSETTCNFAEAVESGIIDPTKGRLTNPEMSLDVAYQKGYIINTRRPWSLQEALVQGLYDPKTCRFRIDGRDVDLVEAIRSGIVNPSTMSVKDPSSARILTLEESIERGLIDPATCRAYDPVSGAEMNLLEALERGFIVPNKRRFSLPEAVFKGFYDPESGKFMTAETDEQIATDRAIRRGILDPSSTIVCIEGNILTFAQAVEDGVIDPEKGKLVGSDRLYDFGEAFEKGLMVEVRKPMTLSEALAKSIFDEGSGTFLDPNSGDYIDLKTAIEAKLIDTDSVYVKDTRAGTWRKVSLPEALRLGYVDGIRGVVKDFSKSGEVVEYSLPEAFEKGLIVDSKAAVSLQRAIHQGLYDDKSGKFSDPSSGRQITLHEAIRKYVVNPLLACYWDGRSEKLLNLIETCRMGIVDRRTGTFKEPGSNVTITLADALSLGLIVDIETANFGLYESVTMGIYDPNTRVLTHPASGRKLTLRDSIKEDLINPEHSIVKNLKTGKYLKLPDAISEGLIDDVSGTYRIPNGRMIDLLDARNRGLVVTSRRPLSLDTAIRNCLYRPDTGKFVDPTTGEYFDVVASIDAGLLDPDSTALKDPTTSQLKGLSLAIESGDIDVPKGRVLDSKSKRAFNLDAAFEKGLLVNVERPVTGYPRPGSVDVTRAPKDPKSVREYSLEEAIKFELIDPDRSVVKDPQSGAFRVLTRAIHDGVVDVARRAVFDPKSKSVSVVLDSGVVVYLREPYSFERALESGHLNVGTGKFVDPVGGEALGIKDAVTSGRIDPDTALVKDGAKKRLVKLPEAFRKGLVDPEKGNVLDTTSSRLHTMAQALDAGLLMTPKRGFSLIEGLIYGLYNPTTGGFTDPFSVAPIIDRKRLNLLEAIERGLIDPSTTVVKDPETGAIEPLLTAVGRRDDDAGRILDPVAGRLVDRAAGKELDLMKAHEKGLILPAEARQAVEEKYRLCDETLTKLLEWVSRVESTLASQQVVREHEEELRNQINTMRQLKDELDAHGHAVSQCADQVRQLVLTAGDVLSKDEVGTLEKNGRSLKQRYDRCCDKAERLLRRLASARDELTKFRNELSVFSNWSAKARRTLEEKERSVSDLGKLSSSAESTREFVSDVIAHKADLRFITMAGQKFIDESKEYLTVLNDFRTSLPQRLHHVEPVPSHESAVSQDVSVATQRYRDLLARANALSDRISGVGGRQRDYTDAVDKAKRWLRDVEPRCNKVLSEPVGAEPKIVEEQLNRAKGLNGEFVAQGRLIDGAVQAVGSLLRSLEGQLSPTEISQLEQPVTDLENKYKQLAEALADKCRELDTALVQSQGVQDALDGLVNWLNQAENQFKSQQRPASLNRDRLDEQLHEQRMLQSDIDSHRASLDSISASASDLLATASNARVAKKIESKMADVRSRFDKLLDKSLKRGEFLDEVHASLATFVAQAQQFERWHVEVMELIESRDLTKLPVDEYAVRMQELTSRRDGQSTQFEDTVLKGRTLVGKKDVTDTVPVRDKIKSIETQWKDLNALLDEKHRLSKQRTEQMNAYERLKDQVVVWLTSTETRVSRLEPVAVDVDALKRQIDELKPIAKEYRDYGPTIDKVNDLGSVYDALLRGDRPESPGRRRSQAYSPTKRTSATVSPLRRMSRDGRSPSPTKTYQLTSPVSPGGSSGFSSRRSSQDGFHLEEMSPVQQQLSEINNRYGLLGVRISDRQGELDSTRDELKKHVDALRTLGGFLDKIERQMPKDNVAPATKDDAEKTSRQYKSIVEEMYERQSLLDSTRSQVKDLLRRKPGALGADRLESDVEDVTARWRAASDRCKERIRFLDDIKDMHDTHDALAGWLAAKERMMTVLGPISSDPRMVQSQVQQVQVLREEFRSQQPQLDHLNAVGDQVLARIPATAPDGQKIADRLSAVRVKWNDLLTKLDGRAESLGAAADTSREFDAGLNRLKDALQGISDNLDDLPLDKDPEDLLRKVENLERQLEGQRPLLADIEAAGAHLTDVLSDPASRAEIQGKLAGVGRQYNALQKKLDHKKAEIEGSLRDGRQLEASCSKTLGWLSEELGGLSERLLVSADRAVLQQQVDHHEPVYRDVMAREHEIIMLLNKGKDVLSKSRGSVETTRPLQRDVDKIQSQWDKLKKETVDRHTRLQTCLEHCRKYYRAQESFLPWLRQAEDKLDTLRPTSYKRKHMDQRLRDLQAFRNDVWKKSGEYENDKTLGEGFLTACDVDKDVVKAELSALKQRWDKLNNELIERTQTIEDASRRIGDFNESVRELEHGVQRCEDSLASHDALGGAAKDPKLLDRVRKLKDDADKLKAPLLVARNSANDLASEAGSNGVDASHLVDEVDAIGDRIEDLAAKLDDRWSELQSAAAAVTQFNDRVKTLTHDLTDLENELDAMRPTGRDAKTVRDQIDEIETFSRKVARISDSVADIVHAGDGLVDSGFAPGDTTQTRQQVDVLGRQLQKLDDRSKGRDAELHDMLDRLQSFYEVHAGVLDDIERASDELRELRPVGSEVDTIRAQQDEFKAFRGRVVEPLTHGVTECVRTGRALVQSAAPGVNTTNLEKDLEKLNEKWNDLKERMNERERKLDVALLQSGKFQEALDGLAKWLTDTEEMVANQKPPSADYKVVKAQLQEQKFLKKMLLDRQSSMSSLFTMGNEIAQGADPVERKAIERQLKELIGRFDKLTEGAQQRTLDLEQAMHVAKKFQDKLVPLQDWLDKTEKKIKDMEMVPTDEEKIQQRIREHEKVHDDVLNRKPDFSELTEIASDLMALVGEDEALGLADKLSEVTDRYGRLVDASDDVGRLLTASRQGLRHLVLTYQDLVAWMDSMEERLGRYRVLAVHTDKLLEQMDDLADLTEEISSRQTSVDGTVDSGLELMKHISSDEALQLKDKLDSLQRRFNDLTSRGVDLLKHAQEALPLVTQFHNSHNRLVDWMLGAESTLSHAEPREDDIARLELDIQELRPVLENINLVGPQLCQISPGEGAATIEALVTRDNRRFDALVEQIQRRAERIHLSKQRSLEVTTDIDELLDWFRDVDTQIREADPPSAEPDSIRLQLKEHKALNDDVSSQKGRARDVLSAARKVLRESSPMEDTSAIREKTEDLRETMDTVSSLSSDRLGVLEQALPLAEHFRETHSGLSAWLDETERQVSALAMPALRPDAIAQQQDRNEMLVQSLNEHRPLLDKLNKTGEALVKLTDPEDGAKIQETVEVDNQRYDALRAELRGRQRALEDALQESSRFADKLEGMLRALSGAADQAASAEPVSAHPPRIRGQIDENHALAGDLEEREEAYNAVKRAADDVINKAGDRQDPAIKDIKRKLEKLNKLWVDVQRATQDRRRTLDDALEAARKFWEELKAVMATLKELEDSLNSQEPPAVEPAAIQKQQVALQEIRHEMDQTKPEVEQVRTSGQRLMRLCGEPDKPEVKKHIEDLDHAWDNITALYAKREENLIDAMEKAMEFHETLQNLLEFLTQAEDRFEKMGPLGSDIETVKKQIAQLRDFKADVDPHMVKVEALNRQAHELSERTSGSDVAAAAAIREPLGAVNARWDALTRAVVDRQRRLEHALLRLGQLQHALEELLVWIKRTDATLDELKPVAGDPQVLEVELAKLKVLVNDIQAHQTSVDTLNDAGRQIIETGKGTDEASTTQDKLSTLNRQWRELLQKATDRQCELEAALREAHTFHAEIQDLLGWLAELDGVIAASKPVGGLPETASEQLERFMEVYNELEQNRAKVETVLQQGQEYLKKSSPTAASNLQHNLRTLKQRWDATTARANDKKIKLEIALKEATEFHDALQAFVDWLTNAEKILTNLKPVSRVMETILTQIEDHKSFQKDVGAHRETMLNLDKKGTHLKYFSQKQDVILIKNLLVSVQHRWERVVSKSAERTRSLDHGYKEAREFHDAYTSLMGWLVETERHLDEANGTETSNDPEKIKLRLSKHREFQRALSAKQTTYDGTMKSGKALKDKAPKIDEVPLKTLLTDLKNKWTTVCSKSVDRQRKLEEALLYSGQFKDAVQALLEWLTKVEKMLSEEGPVHGDLDTVMALVDQHKNFEQDLNGRGAQMESVNRTGRELEATAGPADAETIRSQLDELNGLWKRVGKLNAVKTERLEEALREAERLHKAVHMLLEWLSDAEMKLRFAGPLPDDEQESRNAVAEHSQFLRELAEKEIEKDATIDLAQRILAKSHPDGAAVIKHWITIIQSRWEEVSTWARQREERLRAHVQGLRDLDDMLEELLAWLQGLENTLSALEAEALPDDAHTLETLIDDHKEFMENTANRQTEVDRVCKARQIRTQTKETSARKVSKQKSAVKGSQHDLQREPSPDLYGSLDRKQSFKGSRDHLAGTRKGSRTSPARDVGSNLDNLPHYGPRFPPKGSKGQEPEFKSQRVKLLWDRWRHVWVMAWERQRRLHEKLMYLQELDKVRNFSWEDWRKRFLKFMNHKKSRLTDLFRKMDKDNNGLIPREDFIDGIIKTKFDTSRLEMNAVADLFDRNNSALIDWKEFIAALRPDWEDRKPPTEADKIHDEVKRLVMLCTCRQKFRVFQVGEGKYRFGDSQKLRLVRILRSTVMVRVGGGWVALDEFLQKNDPCRAKGRTNIELREQFILADGVSQSMTAFKPKTPTQRSSASSLTGSSSAGPITKVRERSSRSVPMGGTMPKTSRSSLSAGTPDSLSGDEGIGGSSTPSYARPLRKGSAPVRSTPTGSRPGSKPNSRPSSRPASRAGSKPPSRHGSTLSLDSTDDATPSKIPVSRKTTPASSKLCAPTASSSARKLTVPNGNSVQRPRTPTGLQSPSTPISRARTPSTTTPTTSTSKVQRKDSNASDSARARSNSKSEHKAPFRL